MPQPPDYQSPVSRVEAVLPSLPPPPHTHIAGSPHRPAYLFLRYTATFAACPSVAPLAPVNPSPRVCPFPQHPLLFVVCPPLPDITRSFAEICASSLSLSAVYMPSYHISPTRLSHRSFIATPLVSRAAVCRDATSSSFAVCFHLVSPFLDPFALLFAPPIDPLLSVASICCRSWPSHTCPRPLVPVLLPDGGALSLVARCCHGA